MSNFLQTEEPTALQTEGSNELTASLKVSFYPTTDDLAYVVEKVNKSYRLPSRAQYALQIYLAVNCTGLPLVLWYYEALLAGLAVFLINIALSVVFLPAILRSDYRRYCRVMYGGIENEIVEVELTDEGIWCRHSGDSSFHAWQNIKLLEETKRSIYFFFERNGMAVSKTGFAYDEEKDRFLTFAKKHVKDFTTV